MVVEAGEQCDCGYQSDESCEDDRCCHGRDGSQFDCKLLPGKTCRLVFANNGFICLFKKETVYLHVQCMHIILLNFILFSGVIMFTISPSPDFCIFTKMLLQVIILYTCVRRLCSH